MTTPRKVGVFVGSLRKGAFSRMIAGVLQSIAPPSLVLKIIEIGGLPLYDPDLDEGVTPFTWAQFRKRHFARREPRNRVRDRVSRPRSSRMHPPFAVGETAS